MTTKMSYNQQFYSSKNGTYTGDAEVTPDLHFRMSKKIAQLTKVIYSLKTKTDEHDAVVENLKTEQQAQVQQILQETKVKLESYQAKILGELELHRKLEALESNLVEFEHHKQQALNEFQDYRTRAEKREICLKNEHSERMLNVSQEVLAVKRDFEKQMTGFRNSLKDAELDKINAANELEQKHRLELEKLHETYSSFTLNADSKIIALQELNSAEKDKLKDQISAEKAEHAKIIEDCELKLNKMHAFHEKELAVSKASFQSHAGSELEMLKTSYDTMKQEFIQEKDELSNKVDKLLSQIVMAEQEAEDSRSQITLMKITINSHEDNVSSLNQQLANLRNSHNDVSRKLEAMKDEFSASREQHENQTQQITTKSKLIIKLEVREREQTKVMHGLKERIKELEETIRRLQEDNQKLLGSSMNNKEKNTWQIQELRKTLEDMTSQKKKMEDKLRKELVDLERSSTKKQTDMHNEFTSTVVTLEKQYKDQIEMLTKSSSQEIEMMKISMEQRRNDENLRFKLDKSILEDQLAVITKELNMKVEATEAEVSRLNNTLLNSELGMGAASTQISTLKQHNDNLKKQLSDLMEQFKASKVTIATLQGDIEKLNTLRSSDRRKSEMVLKNKMKQMTEELDNQWTQKLSNETAHLHEELTTKKDTERESALCELRICKELELKDVKEAGDKRICELLQQIANEEIKRQREIEALQKQWMDKGVTETATEYDTKMAAMEAQYNEKIHMLSTDYLNQIQDLERRLKEEHLQGLQTQMLAHRVVVEGAKTEVERKRLQDISQLKTTHFAQMNDARELQLAHHNSDMGRLQQNYERQISGVKAELQHALNTAKEKEREKSLCIEDLQNEIVSRDQQIEELTSNIGKFRRIQEELSQELDSRSHQIQSVRNEAKLKFQRSIEQCEQSKMSELSNLREDHVHDIQNLMIEFHQAQDVLKSRINQLNDMLEESETRLKDRESRPEDLELIHNLRDIVSDKDADIKHLKEEKKYYELELVNRETNFNKIFNSSQSKVSILHAAPPKKKTVDKSSAIVSPHSNSSSSRLDPLPGSPFHEEKLNRVKPLPPPGLGLKKPIKM